VESYQALRTQSAASTPNRHSLLYTKNQVQFKSILAILGIKQVNIFLESYFFPFLEDSIYRFTNNGKKRNEGGRR
jgi:hypothetical protein